MLHQHRQIRNGGKAVTVNFYTEAEIMQANREHDRKYGFSFALQNCYTNPTRLPETYLGPLEKLWEPPVLQT